MRRVLLIGSGLLGASAVGLGAFGAHGLEALIASAPDLTQRLGWWHTAVAYHLPHAGMLAVCAALYPAPCSASCPTPPNSNTRGRLWLSAGGFVLGVVLFCGTLYAMALGAPRWFGAITPIGGLSLIVGWLALAAVGVKGSP